MWVLWTMLISPVSGYPYLVGTSDCRLGSVYVSHCFLLQSSSCCLITWKLGRDRYSQLPTSSVTRVPSGDESAICSIRSAYRLVFWVCASSYPVSKQTVSSITQTSWVTLLHTTMSGRWSVVAMWGGRHRAGTVEGLQGAGIPLVGSWP